MVRPCEHERASVRPCSRALPVSGPVHIQLPDFTQNFNRYSYCLNNPLIFADESREFFVLDSFIAGLFIGGWDKAVQMAKNDLKIWGGLFTSDPNKSVMGRVWEVVSRFIWQPLQTIGGFLTAHA